MTSDDLLAAIDLFLAREDVSMTESTFGRFAVNDGKLVGRLRAGGGLTLDTAEKIQSFIRDYIPSSATAADVAVIEALPHPESPTKSPDRRARAGAR